MFYEITRLQEWAMRGSQVCNRFPRSNECVATFPGTIYIDQTRLNELLLVIYQCKLLAQSTHGFQVLSVISVESSLVHAGT